ncbi:hypothetical protein ACF064_01620 [Streptomyces sp. NPDC015492]|uniref:hypothetical protein n=1 Tax=Streptomyces sp. NPDC015492 TaxID=3364958 RepID=UPI0036FA621D
MSADLGPADPFGPTYTKESDALRAPKDPEGDWWAKIYGDGPDTFSTAPKAPAPAPAPAASPTRDDDQDDAAAPEPGWVWTPSGWQWHGPTPPPPPAPTFEPDAPKTGPAPAAQGAAMIHAALHHTGWHVNRVRWAVFWGSPALVGWGFGAIPALTRWYYDTAHTYSAAGAYVLSAGAVCIGGLIYWRTRGYWPPLAWLLRAPLASAAFAAALYAPAALLHR